MAAHMPPVTLAENATALQNGYALAMAAYASYPSAPADVVECVRQAFPGKTIFQRNWVAGYVAWNESQVLLAFRGTTEEREWYEGLSSGLVPWVVGKAHQGLVEALDAVWEPLMAALFDAAFDGKTLWLTGHSLGGSLATLATQRLDQLGVEATLTGVFGAPRVLDAAAARAYTIPTLRFVNNEDLIADIPWPSLFGDYRHVGEEIRLLASGAVAAPRYTRDLARRIDRALTLGEGPHHGGAFIDHRIANYCEKLRRHGRAASTGS